jgi:flagellin
MALYINSNVSSLTAQRQLNKSTSVLGRTFQRLSSGMRVNSAKDDAASLAIANRMTAQVRGLNQAVRNANDTISLAQVADGALEESVNALQRMRELAVQASNDTLVTSDRDDIQTEVNQLISEIARISADTEFNTQTLLDGGFASKTFQVGAYSGQTIQITVGSATASAVGVDSLNLSSATAAASALTTIDSALSSISDIRATLGAVQNRFESVISNLQNVAENTEASRSRMVDADISQETATLTKYAILQQAGTAILAQANQQPQMALQLLG